MGWKNETLGAFMCFYREKSKVQIRPHSIKSVRLVLRGLSALGGKLTVPHTTCYDLMYYRCRKNMWMTVFFLVFLLLFLICSAPSALLMKYNIITRLFLWTRPRCFWISLQSQTLSQLADKICYFILLKKHYDLLRNAQLLCESSVSVAFLFFIYSRY